MLLPLAVALLSSSGVTPPQEGAVRTMAYHVDFDAEHPSRSLELIEREDPDLVCLTEVTPAFAKEFKRRFANRYPYLHFAPALGTWGVNRTGKFDMAMSAAHVLIAVAFATGVGLFFGYYPARRASKLLPIECLRQD